MMGLGKPVTGPFKHGIFWYQFVRFLGCTLPETDSSHLKMDEEGRGLFPFGAGSIFRGKLAVSFREGISCGGFEHFSIYIYIIYT